MIEAASTCSPVAVIPYLPQRFNLVRNSLLASRSKLEPRVKRRTKLVYLKETPWIKLVTEPIDYQN